jgi:hypothetical protein
MNSSLPFRRCSGLCLGLGAALAVLLARAAGAAADDPQPYYFSTLAGISHIGNADGLGVAARFYSPSSVVMDSAGNLVVADTYNHTIRRITPAGAVTTLAGLAGFSGATDGVGSAARFYYPAGLALDAAGNLFVADLRNATVRKITPAGVVSTLAGSAGVTGSADGTGAEARFYSPQGIAVDAAGTVYVADAGNSTIRRISSAGVVTTLAGSAGNSGSADGSGSAARFSQPCGLAVDTAGTLYVADAFNHLIRRVTPAGAVTTLAGTAGTHGAADGTGSAAQFSVPQGVGLDRAGNVYVADGGNNTIRKITPAGAVTTLAGLAGTMGWADGAGSAARFNFPCSVAVNAANTVFVADTYNSTIRSLAPDGTVTTFAGSAESRGSADGTGSSARFARPEGVAVDGAGTVYVADTDNHTVRRITADGAVTTLAGKAQTSGTTDGTGSAARFDNPNGVAVDGAGTVYVADTRNHTIRRITPSGVVTTFAGAADITGSTDGPGEAARFYEPNAVAVDGAGNVYVADTRNHTIRRITPAGTVTTLAGLGLSSGSADGTGSAARFNNPYGLAVDAAGNVYVADTYNCTIRRITPAGAVSTLAGLAGVDGSADGIGNSARFFYPTCVALDDQGCAYVTDSFNHTIRKGQLAQSPTTSQLQSQSVTAGGSVQFSVTATAVPAPTYQWYFNDTPFSGATGSTLSFTHASSADAGSYSVVVTNPLGSVTSNKATLTVTTAPVTPPPPANGGGSSGGGGGGAPSAWFLLALLTAASARVARSLRATVAPTAHR